MNKPPKCNIKFSAFLLLNFLLTNTANAQTLSQYPLEGSVFVPPNIMLNLDNSYSMYSMITEADYGKDTVVSDWVIGLDSSTPSNFYPDNIPLNKIKQGTCDAGFIEGRLGQSIRCLKLPDPVAGNSGVEDSQYRLHYLKYLFDTYSTSKPVDLQNMIEGNYRMPVLQSATKALLDNSVERDITVNWCTSDLHFSNSDPSSNFVNAPCGSDIETIKSEIDSLAPENGGTPLAEAFYQITNYFRGVSGYTTPIKYRCQNNIALVITDGYPTNDGDITNESKSQHNLTGTETLPDWDGLDGPPLLANEQDFLDNGAPPYSDGWSSINAQKQGGTLFLDDLALFGNEIDLIKTGNDDAGEPYENATLADDTIKFAHQNIKTYTVGFGIDNQMLKDAAAYGGGASYNANNESELSDTLDAVFNKILGDAGSFASATTNTSFLLADNQVFQVKYDSNDWSGSLISHRIDSNTDSETFGEITDVLWNTDTTFVSINSLPPTRNILTVNGETGLPVTLNWDNLSDSQKAYLGNDVTELDYLMGNQSEEVQNGGNFRDRSTLLGDIVHSAPVFVAARDFYYDDPAYYSDFFDKPLVQERSPIVYVGSNDGFLHGFHAPANGGNALGGTEAFAFMPQSIFPHLSELTNPDYTHHYLIDSTPTVVDAQIEISPNVLEWRTILVSPMGAGSEGLFALDVTDPSLFSTLSVNADKIYLWEINNRLPQSSGNAEVTNLALKSSPTQSSTAEGGAASKATDGNTNGNFSSGSVTLTDLEDEAWLELALETQSYIDEIRIWNRSDCCSPSLNNISVFVSTNPLSTSIELSAIQARSDVTEYEIPEEVGFPTILKINEVGKYIRVQLHGSDQLNMAELEVHGTEPNFPFIGHIIDRPSIIRVNTGTEDMPVTSWYAITGNGVHSDGGKAVFYQIDLTTGEMPSGGGLFLDETDSNGIVSNTAIDINGDDFVDRVYVTDIKGNIWRLDWNFATKTFKSFYTADSSEDGDPLAFFNATTTTGDGISQPITSAVEVTRFPGDTGSLMLHVGTGKSYDEEDTIKADVEPMRSFYGIVDRGVRDEFSTLKKSDLVEQKILSGVAGVKAARGIESSDVDYSTKFGWFMDLPTVGERVVSAPLTIKERILFTTLIPFQTGGIDPCINQASGWLMEVDALTGSSPDTVTFDANQDGSFNDDDLVVFDSGIESTYAAGIQPSDGAPLSPSIIRVEKGDGSDGVLKGILSDSSGGALSEFTHEAPVARTSWRRL